MDPLYVELTNYLEKEEEFSWAFKDKFVKKQHRSLSLDKAKPYEMAEDEYIPRAESIMQTKLQFGMNKNAEVNPYL